MMSRERKTEEKKSSRPILTPALAALFLGMLMVPSCGEVDLGKKKAPGPVKPKAVALSGSACVTCHTDKKKLKIETAAIKRPPKSAMTSGKG